ncbi:MAG: isoprenylcysteine carboxylmethyltransferase family protein [Candidatus Thorarchaeota archaeon]
MNDMEEELLFRVVFIVTYGLFFIVRVYFRIYKFYKDRKESTRIEARDEPKEYGKLAKIGMAVIILGYLISAIVYVLIPEYIVWAQFPFPALVRWAGCAVALMTIPLLAWIHITLGKHFSPDLVMKDNHMIVTSGPYSRVRHPMYTVLITFSIGVSIISANLLLIAFSVLLVMLFPFLARQEEQMLLDGLGEEYGQYMERTGRFFPRLRHKEK